jgi:hypothetical protein
MNHRELVLSARKKAKFGFLSLPEELQDEVIEGLDGQSLTLESARDLVKERGCQLSHEAIAGYYRAVRTERRLFEANQELSRIITEYASQPYQESLQSLTNLIIAMAATGLADGSVGIKDIDLGKVLQALGKRETTDDGRRMTEGGLSSPPTEGNRGVINPETIRRVREEIYGV